MNFYDKIHPYSSDFHACKQGGNSVVEGMMKAIGRGLRRVDEALKHGQIVP